MKTKKIWIALLALSATLCVAAGCGDHSSTDNSSTPTQSTPAENVRYTFEIKSTEGTDLYAAGLKIVVYKDGVALTSMGVDNSGKRTKTLPADEYVVRLEKDGEALYSTKTTRNAEEPILLYYATAPTSGAGEEYDRYQIKQGYYSVPLTQEGQAYYSFQPTKAGTYRVSSFGEADVWFRLYEGSDAFLNTVPADSADDKTEADLNFVYNFQITPAAIFNDDGSLNTEYRTIFSVSYSEKATDRSATSCVIAIEYVSEEYTPDALVEKVVLSTADPVLYDANGTVVPFSAQSGTLTPVPYNANFVYNETDRYYHLKTENGPLVVMPFTVTPDRLLDQPFNKIGNPDPNNPSDNANPSTLHLTFTDPETGKKTVKEYNTLINEVYPSAVNEDGMYPLTKEMYEFLYQFVVVAQNDINVQNIPKALRWKAPCYYYETGEIVDDKPDVSAWTGDLPSEGNGLKQTPYVISDGEYCAPFGNVSGVVYYSYVAQADGVVTLTSNEAKCNLYLLRENATASTSETAELIGAGELKIDVQADDILLVQICSTDWEPLAIAFSVSYSEAEADTTEGSVNNPLHLAVGDTSVAGINNVWYVFTPTQSGSYTFSTTDTNTILYLYATAGTDTLIKSSMNSNYNGVGAGFTVSLQAGTTYYLQVAELSFENFSLPLKVELN